MRGQEHNAWYMTYEIHRSACFVRQEESDMYSVCSNNLSHVVSNHWVLFISNLLKLKSLCSVGDGSSNYPQY